MRRMYWTVAAVIGSTLVCSGEQLEFDAASVKVADPSASRRAATGGPGSGAPGRYSVRAALIDIMKTAYGVADDQISGGPEWLRSTLYEVDAIMPRDTTKERFQTMLQNLLVQRFHLSIHRETQNFPAFALVMAEGGPKFKETGAGAAGGAGSPEPGGAGAAANSRAPTTDPNGFPVLPPGPHTGEILWRGNLLCKFQERSMAYFADRLGIMIYYDVLGPSSRGKAPRVFDKTGLNGKYDFTLEFACERCVAASPTDSPAPADGTAAGSDGPSIYQAVEKQLGLKIVKARDVPLEVLVVDRAERIPIPN